MDKTEETKAIGGRLRTFREALQIPRSRFAVSIGYGSERIASYEAGRAPLPYAVFVEIANRFHLNPFWLATGQGDQEGKITGNFPNAVHLGEPKNAKFINVFNRHIAGIFPVKSFTLPGEVISRQLQSESVRALIDDCFISVPKNQVRPFAELLQSTINNFLQEHGLDDPNSVLARKVMERELRKAATTIHLTRVGKHLITKAQNESAPLANNPPEINVQVALDNPPPLKEDANAAMEITSLSELVNKLRALTKERGMKAALAKECKVSRQAVDQWLAETSSPSAEAVFAALRFVRRGGPKK